MANIVLLDGTASSGTGSQQSFTGATPGTITVDGDGPGNAIVQIEVLQGSSGRWVSVDDLRFTSPAIEALSAGPKTIRARIVSSTSGFAPFVEVEE